MEGASPEDDVRTWLEKGGFVLEMKVARQVAARTSIVFQGQHYTDPVTGKEREIDVGGLIYHSGPEHWHAVQLTIECKGTSAPWIVFLGDRIGNGPWTPTWAFADDCEDCEGLLSGEAALRRSVPSGYAITEKRAKNSQPDHAYEAIQQVTSAIIASHEHPDRSASHEDHQTVSHIGTAIVVTESPLFTCSLDESAGVHVERVDVASVLVPRLDVPDREADGVEVFVVTFDALDDLLDKVESLLDELP